MRAYLGLWATPVMGYVHTAAEEPCLSCLTIATSAKREMHVELEQMPAQLGNASLFHVMLDHIAFSCWSNQTGHFLLKRRGSTHLLANSLARQI